MRSRMLLLVILTSVSGALVSCAKAPIQMTTENRSLLKSPPFYSVHSPLPKLSYRSRGEQTTAAATLGGGAIGALLHLLVEGVVEVSHDDLVALYHLENPSLLIEQTLAQRIAQEYDLTDIRQNEEMESWDDPEDLKRRFSQGLLLQVWSDRWALEPSSWSQFHIVLSIRARLVSLQDTKEMWYDTCVRENKDETRDPTMEDLKAKDGALLKSMLKDATETCTDVLWHKFQMIAMTK